MLATIPLIASSCIRIAAIIIFTTIFLDTGMIHDMVLLRQTWKEQDEHNDHEPQARSVRPDRPPARRPAVAAAGRLRARTPGRAGVRGRARARGARAGGARAG